MPYLPLQCQVYSKWGLGERVVRERGGGSEEEVEKSSVGRERENKS